MGAAIEVPLALEPAHIKPVNFLQRGACALPPVPPPRARTTHAQHSCPFLVEIIREITPLLALPNAFIPSNDTAKCLWHSIIYFDLL
jgi:hypothetical protein